jgi:hypothetical protein
VVLGVGGDVGGLGLGGRRDRGRREGAVGPPNLGPQHLLVVAVGLPGVYLLAAGGLLVHARGYSTQLAVSLPFVSEKLRLQRSLAGGTSKAARMVAQPIGGHTFAIQLSSARGAP